MGRCNDDDSAEDEPEIKGTAAEREERPRERARERARGGREGGREGDKELRMSNKSVCKCNVTIVTNLDTFRA